MNLNFRFILFLLLEIYNRKFITVKNKHKENNRRHYLREIKRILNYCFLFV